MILLLWIVGGFVGVVATVAVVVGGFMLLGTLLKASKDLWS
jgi:hypothetical protein